jgi:hypothetical protein
VFSWVCDINLLCSASVSAWQLCQVVDVQLCHRNALSPLYMQPWPSETPFRCRKMSQSTCCETLMRIACHVG